MNFEDERYIRIYVRDTLTWKRLRWQGTTFLTHALRKVDRAGVLDLAEGLEGLADLIGLPKRVTLDGLKRCVKYSVATLTEHRIFFPRFLPAQEAKQSDALRARESRGRRREFAAAEAHFILRPGTSTGLLDSPGDSVISGVLEPDETTARAAMLRLRECSVDADGVPRIVIGPRYNDTPAKYQIEKLRACLMRHPLTMTELEEMGRVIARGELWGSRQIVTIDRLCQTPNLIADDNFLELLSFVRTPIRRAHRILDKDDPLRKHPKPRQTRRRKKDVTQLRKPRGKKNDTLS